MRREMVRTMQVMLTAHRQDRYFLYSSSVLVGVSTFTNESFCLAICKELLGLPGLTRTGVGRGRVGRVDSIS